ncbi:MAG TPA: lysophospholipid acyltransferase family protein [Phycisphaerae bacterium]|jgi:KDO2-lipid IV(A) lauroyltransferase|nr:lysophospholipid acyltransferase family protein [Phycisphaerae bacterium]HQE44532.1 lysophospholipid acyltransferase family protein [Phycisphaerae bacterium]
MARRRPLIDWLIYCGIRLVGMAFQMFPINVNLRTARWMGSIWYRLMRRHRERAFEHLRLAYGNELSQADRERIALASMQQMTMLAVETLFTPRLINEWTWPRYVRLKNLGPAADVLLSRRGAILVTGHYGSWELLGFTLTALGFPTVAVMRPLDNPYLNSYVMDVRARRGLQLLYKKGAARSAGEILSSGGTLAFIADQNAGHKGLFVDFFGHKASTYKSIGLLAIEYKVPIVVGYARRVSDRFEYELGCNRVIHPEEWAGKDDELRWITQEYTRAIEAFIREAPEQYLWIHRRWKSRPRDELAVG